VGALSIIKNLLKLLNKRRLLVLFKKIFHCGSVEQQDWRFTDFVME